MGRESLEPRSNSCVRMLPHAAACWFTYVKNECMRLYVCLRVILYLQHDRILDIVLHTYICIHMHVSACVCYIYICRMPYVYIYICVCLFIHLSTYFLFIHLSIFYLFIDSSIYIYIYTYIYVYVHITYTLYTCRQSQIRPKVTTHVKTYALERESL